MPRLAMLAFRDVVVTPYTGRFPYRQGGPRWPEWSKQTAARHCVRGVPEDEEPPEAEPTATLAGPVAWGGAITWAFGHQVAGFSTRLLPTLDERPDVRFAFAGRAETRLRELDQTPSFFRDILDWYGIAAERVDLIAEPTLVERLVVAPQGEQSPRPGPEPWYLDLLDAHTKLRLGQLERSGSLYVSRAGLRAGRFAGEAYLERVMAEAGFRVLRPETVSKREELRCYAGAESIVFAEGSALHCTQLMGRALGDVTVLSRRPGMKVAQAALYPRARSVHYVDAVRSLVHGVDTGGGPAMNLGLAVLDPDRLLAALPIGDVWNEAQYAAARDADIREWLETEQASPRWALPGSSELVSETLQAAGLAHLQGARSVS